MLSLRHTSEAVNEKVDNISPCACEERQKQKQSLQRMESVQAARKLPLNAQIWIHLGGKISRQETQKRRPRRSTLCSTALQTHTVNTEATTSEPSHSCRRREGARKGRETGEKQTYIFPQLARPQGFKTLELFRCDERYCRLW